MAAESFRGDAAPVLIAAAAAVAVADWVAVGTGRRSFEAALKPLVPLILAVAAAPHSWFVAALLLCLVGDVLLLPQIDRFRSGLAAFLGGHVAFIGGFLALPFNRPGLVLLPVILPPLLGLAVRILTAAPRSLRGPVAVYVLALVVMLGVAASRPGLAFYGAFVFVTSDTVLAWNRFVRPFRGARLAVMVTYHLALGLLTIAAWS